ncbi:hypothetical protein K440DRAFT_611204 [Wilcoxina mikolae CBS 423.85]|nr:hypothetical protein K440DRAFT_611204 [Wilcoxina mikolae CBS 423.85]
MSPASTFCIIFALHSLPLEALPITPNANETRVGWRPEPDGRGSFTILILCTATIGLCVWTALHLNVEPISLRRGNDDLEPPPNFVGKCLWAFITLVAPEMVSAVALHQNLVTRRYRKCVNVSGQGGKVIGMTQAFYATMGGIAQVELVRGRIRSYRVRVTDRQGHIMEGEVWDPVLTPLRFDRLLEAEWMGLIRRFSIVEVGIRSKQDALAKLLVFAQALWVLVQCVSRRIQNLPISPLELHTALYIVNLMGMYGAWWQKPVDLGRPIFMSKMKDSTQNVGSSTQYVEGPTQYVSIVVNQDTGPEWLEGRPSLSTVQRLSQIRESLGLVEDLVISGSVDGRDPIEGWRSLTTAMDETGYLIMIWGDNREIENIEMIQTNQRKPNKRDSKILEIALREMRIGASSAHTEDGIQFTESHAAPLRKAQELVIRCLVNANPEADSGSHPTWKQKLKDEISTRIDILLHTMSKSLVWNQVIQIPGLFNRNNSNSGLGGHQMSNTKNIELWFNGSWQIRHRIILLTFVGFTGAAYGGIHALKWSEPFPTAIEQQLWQISSCVGALGIVPVVLLGIPGFSDAWITQERPRRYFNSACVVCGVVTGLAFAVARTFLVIESFISLRSLPVGSFKVVKWLDLFGSAKSIGQQ